jgi:hypothetical protein
VYGHGHSTTDEGFLILVDLVPADAVKRVCPEPAAQETDQATSEHEQGEGCVEEEDGHKGQRCHGNHDQIRERAPADADDGLDDDGHHRRLETVEESLNKADILEAGVKYAQHEDADKAGKHEERARYQPARHAV